MFDLDKEYMLKAIEASMKNSNNHFRDGGPFGAVLVKDGQIISISSNSVLKDNDPTAHAEINVIRESSEKLGTCDLSGSTIYTSCFPCPMCLGAIMWANIKEIYYGNTKEDASSIGFKDDLLYNTINNIGSTDEIRFKQICKNEALKVFEEYKSDDNKGKY